MLKLNYGSNKDNILNPKVKSRLGERRIRKIRKKLLFLTKMDIKTSKVLNVIIIKNDENENKIARPTFVPQRNYLQDIERTNQNELNTENETDFDTLEQVDSSDISNEENKF